MSLVKSTIAMQLENIVYKMASDIFNNITPLNQKSQVSKDDVSISLNNLSNVVNSNEAYSYLTDSDSFYMRSLTTAIDSGMRNVLSDSKITISDIPTILKMVKDIVYSVNHIHSKKSAIVQISKHSLLPLIETIICITAQMLLTSGQYEIVRGIILLAFELLDTTLEPLLLKSKWCVSCTKTV
jgi:hypothetical protein